jgi:hypothetical protein
MAAEIRQVPVLVAFAGKFIMSIRNKVLSLRQDVSNQTLGNGRPARYRDQSWGRDLPS